MARKHTIFIGALFHVAIAMFKTDRPTLDNVVQGVTWSRSPPPRSFPQRQPGLGNARPETGEA